MNTYDNGVILKYNVDENGRPTSWLIANEQQQVNPLTNTVQLVQIPDEHQRLTVWDEYGNRLTEVFDIEVVGEDNFKVTYPSGLVAFHPNLAGQTVTFTYYGRGVELVSTKRIYHKGNKEVYEVLHDVIEGANEAMEVIGTLGGVAETITKLEEKIVEGNDTVTRIEELVTELETYGYTILLSREAFIVKADDEGEVGKSEISSVYSDVVVYKGGRQITPIITLENQVNSEFMVDNQRIKLLSLNINSIKSSVDVVIDCGDGLVVRRTLEVTKVFDGKVPYVINMTNPIYGFMANSEGIVETEQTVICEVEVTKADVDYPNFTIAPKNIPSGLACRVSGNTVEITCRKGNTLPNNGSMNIVVTIDGKAYPKTFTWSKILSGADAKSLTITGGQIMKYATSDYSDVPSPHKLTISCNTKGLSGTPKWYAKHNGEFVLLSAQTTTTLTVNHSDVTIWNNQTETTVKCEIDGYSDEMSIVKLANGENGQSAFNVMLSNENQSVFIGADGVVPQSEIDKVWTLVYAYVGVEPVIPILTKGAVTGCDISITGNRVQLTSLDNSFSTSTATVIVEYNGISVNKVLTISKAKQGSTGDTGASADNYILSITEGTRSFTYSQINREPRPSQSATFIASLYENGNEVLDVDGVSYYWLARGHVGGSSATKEFTPTIRSTLDESVMSNDIVVVATYKGQTITQVVPIAITKDADGLDWVQDWDGTKVEIKGSKLLAPKLFAGTYDSVNDVVTGVSIGQDVLGTEGNVSGIVGYQNNEPTFVLDTAGNVQVGDPFTEGKSGLFYNGNQFILKADSVAIGGVNVPTQDDVNDYVDGQISGVHDSMNSMNEGLRQDIIDVNNKLNDFELNFNEIILDGIITDIEKAKLESIFTGLEKEVGDINKQYSDIYNNALLTNKSVKDQLKIAHDDYVTAFNNLKGAFEQIINSTHITPELIEDYNTKMATFRIASQTVSSVLNTALLSISESLVASEIETAKNVISGEINEVSNSLADLGDYVDGAFKEGMLSINDIKVLQERIVQLDKEYSDINGQYEPLYTNPKLSASKKQLLYTVKTELDLIHQEIKGEINKAIVDYIITEGEMTIINTVTSNYNKKLKEFVKTCNECIEDIAKNNSQTIVDALDQEAIFNKLTNNGEVQGLYLQNGKLYINGEYINARNLTVVDNSGKETFKIDSAGRVKAVVSDFTIESGGTTNVPTVDEVYNKGEVDDKIDEVNSRNMYKVEIISSNGAIFKNGEINTTLNAVLYNWDTDVTDMFPVTCFKWKRISSDPQGDEIWNANHSFGSKWVDITSADVQCRATFQVDIIDSNGLSILHME